MEIIDFYASDNKDHWLSEINKSDWRAGGSETEGVVRRIDQSAPAY